MKKSLILMVFMMVFLEAQVINRIEFINLSQISSEIASENLEFSVGDSINARQINRAIKKFYEYGYFKDVWVENNSGIVQFYFKEKPVIANISMTGYKQREDDLETLYMKMGLKKGYLFDQKRLDKAKEILLKELNREGYINSVVEVTVEEFNEESMALLFDVNKGEEIIIKKVNYFGAQQLNTSHFEEVTANKEEDFLPWFYGQNDGEVKLDQLPYEEPRIKNVYLQYGYLDVQVEKPFMTIDFTSNNAVLNFFIQEGKQYSVNDISITLDNSVIKKEELYSDLILTKKSVFNIELLRQDIELIRTKIANLGYAFTEVRYDLKKDSVSSSVDVIYQVITGEKVYINDVIISGNMQTLDRVIRRNVYLAPGDLFNLTDLKDSRNKLKRSGFFDSVDIQQNRVTNNKIDLLVKVKETSTGNITLGGGYGSYDGFLVTAGIKDKNIFGSGKAVGIQIDYSKHRNDFDLFFKNPSINDSQYHGSMNLYSKTREVEYSSPDYSFEKESLGISLGLGTEITRHLSSGAVYTLETIKETYTDDNASDTYNPFTYKNNDDYILSSIKPYLGYDSTDDYLFPKNGVKARTSLEFAGVGGDAKFLKSISNYKYFHSFKEKFDLDWVLRYKSSLRFLVDNGKITQGDSFYLGGINTLRGYKAYAFGPDSDSNDPAFKKMFANAVELSFPLISEKSRWNIFYDYGMIGEDSLTQIKRSSVGAALEWISPIGPIQLIFASPLDDKPGDDTTSFEFSLGQSF